MKSGITFGLFFVFIKFRGFLSVPHEFCLEPFDNDDCEGPPTPVFYYYKPGSRCEIGMWRGCPTLNRFSDEFLCSHYCIGKLTANHENMEALDAYIEKEAAKNEWVEELETLDIKEIKAIDEILDHTRQKLSLIKKNKPETVPDEVLVTTEPDGVVEHEEVDTEAPTEAPEEHQELEEEVTEEPVAVTTTEHQKEEELGSADEVVTT